MPTYKSGTSMVLGVEETLIDGASEGNDDVGDTDCTSILGSVVPAVITLVGTKLWRNRFHICENGCVFWRSRFCVSATPVSCFGEIDFVFKRSRFCVSGDANFVFRQN